MVIVKLFGGLGNQMFQYAAGRSLSLRNNCPLKLDITHFDNKTLPNGLPYRSFDLSIFKAQLNIATSKEIKKFFSSDSLFAKAAKKIDHLFNDYKLIHEPYFHFYPDLLKVKGNVYLEGYWQSEKYFKEYEDIIRNDFNIDTTLGKEGEFLLKNIKDTNSVCLNIRRKEFASNKYINQFVGSEYIYNAIELMAKKVKDPHFYVFSDELDWVKSNIVIKYKHTIVEENLYGDRFRDCLLFMSSCKNFIIPNSTFGWWAAWLNNDPDKIVISPSDWLADKTKDTSDLILSEWIRL
ncbi:MAG TPA: alpha-1,2-fucosyltransferase [Bacteroidia bacterium]|jgi:hypothetical protein